MISEYIRYNLPPNAVDEFEPAYQQASQWLERSSHCVDYELSRCTEDPAKWILHIHWDSHEGHMQGFRSSGEFQHFYKHVAPFIPYIEEMRHYDLTSVAAAART